MKKIQMKKIIFMLLMGVTFLLAVDTTKSTGVSEQGEPRFVIKGDTHGAFGSVIYVKNISDLKDEWRLERLGREKLSFTTICDKSLFDNNSANCTFNFANGVELNDTISLMK